MKRRLSICGCVLVAALGCSEKSKDSARETADLMGREVTQRAEKASDSVNMAAEAVVEADKALGNAVVRETRGEIAAARAEANALVRGAVETVEEAHEAGELAEEEAEERHTAMQSSMR